MKPCEPHLRAFLKVAELGGFTAAAASLGLSQPALSRTVRSLEASVGARLFDRHTRSLALTPAGVELRAIALRITAEVDRGWADFANYLACRKGRITISILPSAATLLFPTVTRSFRKLFPDVLIQIRDGSQEPVVDDVLQGRADFAVAMKPHSEELQFQSLFADEFVFVGSKACFKASGARVAWTIFRDYPFIALAERTSIRRMTDAAFQQIGLDIAPRHECGHPATAISLTAAGLGVTALPRLTLPAVLDNGLITRELDHPVVSRSIGILTLASIERLRLRPSA